ncbi:MAG: hypothetical protein A2W00_04905 [Candidatus Eisenbacteria bacterium RBG_16_71_46]|nr:MAG: hypothetical protein A2W00_04905 [Candidatus Eisenbacteria bacterium RBG_16_71_46]
MNFATDAQRVCYEKVAGLIKEMFGEMAAVHPDQPSFGLRMGSALAQVVVHPWGKDDATVSTRSYVVIGAEVTPELMRYLLRKNDEFRFGAFGLDSEGDIFFEHSIVGSGCDKNELRACVLAVAQTADEYDEEIVSRWGGQRALDKIR